MSLAKALLEAGERDVVLRYFDLCDLPSRHRDIHGQGA
jgi:hypothetical protein